jgi:hypothetical protein
MMSGPASIGSWLASVNTVLEQYADRLSDYGYENVDLLLDADEADLVEALTELKVKKPHAKSLLKSFRVFRDNSARIRNAAQNDEATPNNTEAERVSRLAVDSEEAEKYIAEEVSSDKDSFELLRQQSPPPSTDEPLPITLTPQKASEDQTTVSASAPLSNQDERLASAVLSLQNKWRGHLARKVMIDILDKDERRFEASLRAQQEPRHVEYPSESDEEIAVPSATANPAKKKMIVDYEDGEGDDETEGPWTAAARSISIEGPPEVKVSPLTSKAVKTAKAKAREQLRMMLLGWKGIERPEDVEKRPEPSSTGAVARSCIDDYPFPSWMQWWFQQGQQPSGVDGQLCDQLCLLLGKDWQQELSALWIAGGGGNSCQEKTNLEAGHLRGRLTHLVWLVLDHCGVFSHHKGVTEPNGCPLPFMFKNGSIKKDSDEYWGEGSGSSSEWRPGDKATAAAASTATDVEKRRKGKGKGKGKGKSKKGGDCGGRKEGGESTQEKQSGVEWEMGRSAMDMDVEQSLLAHGMALDMSAWTVLLFVLDFTACCVEMIDYEYDHQGPLDRQAHTEPDAQQAPTEDGRSAAVDQQAMERGAKRRRPAVDVTDASDDSENPEHSQTDPQQRAYNFDDDPQGNALALTLLTWPLSRLQAECSLAGLDMFGTWGDLYQRLDMHRLAEKKRGSTHTPSHSRTTNQSLRMLDESDSSFEVNYSLDADGTCSTYRPVLPPPHPSSVLTSSSVHPSLACFGRIACTAYQVGVRQEVMAIDKERDKQQRVLAAKAKELLKPLSPSHGSIANQDERNRFILRGGGDDTVTEDDEVSKAQAAAQVEAYNNRRNGLADEEEVDGDNAEAGMGGATALEALTAYKTTAVAPTLEIAERAWSVACGYNAAGIVAQLSVDSDPDFTIEDMASTVQEVVVQYMADSTDPKKKRSLQASTLLVQQAAIARGSNAEWKGENSSDLQPPDGTDIVRPIPHILAATAARNPRFASAFKAMRATAAWKAKHGTPRATVDWKKQKAGTASAQKRRIVTGNVPHNVARKEPREAWTPQQQQFIDQGPPKALYNLPSVTKVLNARDAALEPGMLPGDMHSVSKQEVGRILECRYQCSDLVGGKANFLRSERLLQSELTQEMMENPAVVKSRRAEEHKVAHPAMDIPGDSDSDAEDTPLAHRVRPSQMFAYTPPHCGCVDINLEELKNIQTAAAIFKPGRASDGTGWDLDCEMSDDDPDGVEDCEDDRMRKRRAQQRRVDERRLTIWEQELETRLRATMTQSVPIARSDDPAGGGPPKWNGRTSVLLDWDKPSHELLQLLQER